MVEVDLRGEPRKAVAEALLCRLGVVAEEGVGEEPKAVVVDDAVGYRDRAVAGDLERGLVGPGLGDRVRADAGAQLVAEVVRLHTVGGAARASPSAARGSSRPGAPGARTPSGCDG